MSRRGRQRGPRQPGGGKQAAGPRHRGSGRERNRDERKGQHRHPEERGKRASKGDGPAHRRKDSPFHPRSEATRRGEAGGRSERPQRAATPDRQGPGRAQARPPQDEGPEAAVLSTSVQTVTVSADENGMRLDRFFEAKFPGLSFSHIQRIIRKGEVRVNGKRSEPKSRIKTGDNLRIPPLKLAPPKLRDDAPQVQKDRAFLKSITLHEDDDVLVLNKPAGLAVQGGSGTTHHVDGMLGALTPPGKDAQRPRLVHRLDKDTAGCLLIAKSRFAAAALAKTFRSRSARKIYWAMVVGVPKPKQGRISTFLAKEEREEDSFMRIASHGEEGASHAVTYYALVETSGQNLAWLSLKPVTGRTHQLRAHMAHIHHPIVGDPKYFNKENWQLPGGMQNKLHLLARRIAVPHPRGGKIDVTAPLPDHMQQSFNLLGLDASRYDPIEEAPEE